MTRALFHLYEQRAPKGDGRGSGVGPRPTAVLGDIHDSASAEEGHVRGQTTNSGGTGHVSVRDSYPVTVDHEPQIRLLTSSARLGGEEELVDSFDRSSEHSGSSVEGPAYVHQHLAVLDSVHFSCELPRIRNKEVDLLGRKP